jgi:hypothetical protein
MIPNWLLQIGSLAGLAALLFGLFDRFVTGRPITTIRKTGYHTREIYCFNASRHDVVIRKIWGFPKWVRISRSENKYAIAHSMTGGTFSTVLLPNSDKSFPLMISKGDLVDDDSESYSPFVIWISWRKARSNWLPQFPAIIFYSVKSIRKLEAAD